MTPPAAIPHLPGPHDLSAAVARRLRRLREVCLLMLGNDRFALARQRR
ncbi:hypothetical protein [Hymenobacter rigui]|nr:hypothetical protein [Hymenobacter rigui]